MALKLKLKHSEDENKKFWNFKEQGLFCDWILSADSKNVLVHRFIVQKASPFLRKLSKECSKNSMTVFDHLSFENLELVIKLIYLKKVETKLSEVPSFCEALKSFQLTYHCSVVREPFSVNSGNQASALKRRQSSFHPVFPTAKARRVTQKFANFKFITPKEQKKAAEEDLAEIYFNSGKY